MNEKFTDIKSLLIVRNIVTAWLMRMSCNERLHLQPRHPDMKTWHDHFVLHLGAKADQSAEQLLAFPLKKWRGFMHRHANLFGVFPAANAYLLMLALHDDDRWLYTRVKF